MSFGKTLIKFLFFLFFSILQITAYAQFDTIGPINKRIINSVIEIKKGNEMGSGFLVLMGTKQLLVTNKHLIGNWSPVDSLILSDSIIISLYSKKGSEPSFLRINVKICNSGIPIPYKLKIHPNNKIDIAVIDITNDIKQLSLNNTKFIDTSLLLKLNETTKFLTYGSQVFTIGYPAGIKNFKTNQPLVKSGYIASSLDGNLKMEQTWINRNKQAITTLTDGKIFIVDGLIIPGNSGGPVVATQEVTWFEFNGVLQHLINPQNYFIGIVSNIYNSTGLSTIFASDNILEVINQFK